MRIRSILLALLLATVTLAGCAAPDEKEEPTPTTTATPDATPTPTAEVTPTPTVEPTPVTPTPDAEPTFDNSTYTLGVSGQPTTVKVNAPVSFNLTVSGAPTFASDHVGAHFANNTTAAPVASAMGACPHAGGSLPGSFMVNCTFDKPGTYHIYGHARAVVNGTSYDYWATPFAVVVRDVNVTITVPTAPVTSGTAFEVTLNVTGVENFTSNHIGAHFWNATNANPTSDNATGTCDHVEGGVVGVHKVRCTLTNTGITPDEYFIRGHVRLADGATTFHWWSVESKVTVAPSLI